MTTEHAKAFAEKLRTVREAAGLSQYAVAKQTGLSKQYLSRLELAECEPSWVTVQLLALALDVSCETFIEPGLKLPELEPARPVGRPKKEEEPAAKRPRGNQGVAPASFEPGTIPQTEPAEKRPKGRPRKTT